MEESAKPKWFMIICYVYGVDWFFLSIWMSWLSFIFKLILDICAHMDLIYIRVTIHVTFDLERMTYSYDAPVLLRVTAKKMLNLDIIINESDMSSERYGLSGSLRLNTHFQHTPIFTHLFPKFMRWKERVIELVLCKFIYLSSSWFRIYENKKEEKRSLLLPNHPSPLN